MWHVGGKKSVYIMLFCEAENGKMFQEEGREKERKIENYNN